MKMVPGFGIWAGPRRDCNGIDPRPPVINLLGFIFLDDLDLDLGLLMLTIVNHCASSLAIGLLIAEAALRSSPTN